MKFSVKLKHYQNTNAILPPITIFANFFSANYIQFNLNECFKTDRPNPKCGYIHYKPPNLATFDEVNSHVFKNIPRVGSVVSPNDGFLESDSDPRNHATEGRYTNVQVIRLVGAPIVFFIEH